MKNFLFIGGTYRGFKVFERMIAQGHFPCFCYILQEDPHEVMRFSDMIANLCKKFNIPFEMRKKLMRDDYMHIESIAPLDFALVCGWRSNINLLVEDKFKFGIVNTHDSLLPKYRGFAPLNWVMINGEEETGITLFLMKEGEPDSGPMISSRIVPIEDNDYARDVYEKISDATVDLNIAFIEDYYSGKTINLIPQNEAEATYTCKRTPDDGRINWKDSSLNIYNLIRGIAHPYPGAYCEYYNEFYHIRKATLGPQNGKKFAGRVPGRVISVSDEGIEVMCGVGTILIREWEQKARNIVGNPSQAVRFVSSTLK